MSPPRRPTSSPPRCRSPATPPTASCRRPICRPAAVAECRELFGTVVGDGDPLWTLHADVARQAIALGALSADDSASGRR